jgi:hypothetical protein
MSESAHTLAKENAARFLAGVALKTNNMHPERKQLEVFAELIKCDRFPLLRVQEREISDRCKVSSTVVVTMAKALIEAGWRPSVCFLPVTRKLDSADVNTWGLEATPPQ